MGPVGLIEVELSVFGLFLVMENGLLANHADYELCISFLLTTVKRSDSDSHLNAGHNSNLLK